MKRLYTLSAALLFLATSTSYAQKATNQQDEPRNPLTETITKKATVKKAVAKGGTGTVYWSEDFSNGFAGQGANGAWTTEGAQGDLWFQTFPAGAPDGYDPASALPASAQAAYGTNIPNYFGAREVAQSPTRDNGVMMVDGDRWNSTSTEESPDGTLTQNAFSAELVSPIMDLTDAAETGARLTFHQYARLCCSGYSLTLGVSLDGGESYIPYDVFNPYGGGNDDIDQEISICLVDVIQGAADLTQMRLKFSWDGSQSHYFWMIDDIQITSPPLNDAEIGRVYYDRYDQVFDNPESTYQEYYQTLEYQNTPNYLLKPISVGAVVTNRCSQNTQTNVTVNTVVTAPDGTTQPISTESVDLAPGVSDTIYSVYTFLSAFDEGQVGDYSISYELVQEEDDEIPANNMGDERVFTVNSDQESDGFAYMQNGGTSYDGAFNQIQFAQDALVNTPYTFQEPLTANAAITHIEVVFLFSADFAETMAGELVYFNVREGAIGDEVEGEPETITGTFFDSENPLTYEDFALEYIIEETDIWNSTDGFPQNYVTFELPTPILIEPGVVYSPEVRIPAAGDGIVYFPVSTDNTERQAIWLYNFSGDAVGWGPGADAIPSMRFRTNSIESIDDITYDSGMQLVQNWPNPAVDNTRIQYRLDRTMDITFEVYDMAGKLVHTEDMGNVPAGVAQQFDFNVSALSSGVYTYSIVSNDTRVTRKLTVK